MRSYALIREYTSYNYLEFNLITPQKCNKWLVLIALSDKKIKTKTDFKNLAEMRPQIV